jgi:O-antigen ligase
MLLKFIYTSALLGVGGLALVLPSGYSYGFYVICLVGLLGWLTKRDALIPLDARYMHMPLLAYALVHMALAMHEKAEIRVLNDYLPFVLLFFGVWGLRSVKPHSNWFWIGLSLGAVGAATLAGYQSLYLGLRAYGNSQPIQFGNSALLFGVLCLVRLLNDWRCSLINLVLMVGVASGIGASVFSQTRGGWLAVLLILGWILLQATRGWSRAQRWGAVALFAVMLAVPSIQSNGIVQKRVGLAVAEFNAFFETGQQDSAVGSRLAMWRVAVLAMGDAPWLGQGNQGWNNVRDAAIANGSLSDFSAGYSHLHNEYLNVAFKKGLLGLAFFLGMYLVPMLYFFKPYLNHENSEVRALAMAGMVIPMMYMDFGLTQSFLTHNSGRVVLCSLWMCVAALMLNALEDHELKE